MKDKIKKKQKKTISQLGLTRLNHDSKYKIKIILKKIKRKGS